MTLGHYPTKIVASPTSRLRYRKRKLHESYTYTQLDFVLQQRWVLRTVTDGDGSIGVCLSESYEWRDVPTEEETP
jgi:hypothetical protein